LHTNSRIDLAAAYTAGIELLFREAEPHPDDPNNE
jgi:hypothetical protein